MADTEFQTLALDTNQFQAGAAAANQAATKLDDSLERLMATLRELAAAHENVGRRSKKAGDDIDDAGGKVDKAAKKTANWSQVGQGLSRTLQDVGQAGGDWTQKLGAGINNIEQVVGNLPAKFAGLASPLTAIATISLLVVQNWETISSLWSGPKSKIPEAAEDLESLEDRLRTVNKELDDFREKSDLQGLSTAELAKYNETLARRVELEGKVNEKKKQRQEMDRLEALKGQEETDRSQAIDKAIEASGGWDTVVDQLARRSIAYTGKAWESYSAEYQEDARKQIAQLFITARSEGGSSLAAIQKLGSQGQFGWNLDLQLNAKQREADRKAFEQQQKDQQERAEKLAKDQQEAQKKAQAKLDQRAEQLAGAGDERFLRSLLENRARDAGDPRKMTDQEFGMSQTSAIRNRLLATGAAGSEAEAQQLGDLVVRKLWEKANQAIQQRSMEDNVGAGKAQDRLLDEARKKAGQESGQQAKDKERIDKIGAENEEIIRRTLEHLGPQIQAALMQDRARGVSAADSERARAHQVEQFLRRAGYNNDPLRTGGIAFDVVGRAMQDARETAEGAMGDATQLGALPLTPGQQQRADQRRAGRRGGRRSRPTAPDQEAVSDAEIEQQLTWTTDPAERARIQQQLDARQKAAQFGTDSAARGREANATAREAIERQREADEQRNAAAIEAVQRGQAQIVGNQAKMAQLLRNQQDIDRNAQAVSQELNQAGRAAQKRRN